MSKHKSTEHHHKPSEERPVSGEVKIHGGVQVFEAESAIQEHKAEREEDEAHKKTTHAFERSTLIVSRIMLGVTTLYWIATILIFWQSKRSADAADSAATTAAKQLELTERPWVYADIAVDGPFEFTINGANIHAKVLLHNTGNSPAQFVRIFFLPLIGIQGSNAGNHRNEACQRANEIASQFGMTLFPNTTFDYRVSIGLGKGEMDKAAKEPFGTRDSFENPAVVACIAYRPTFKSATYHTAYVLDIYRIDPQNLPQIMFKIGENVDADHLRFRLAAFNSITTD